ncbi:UNVERIFIED_CONTAM: hypothetical protein GTU68_061703 [Idotea baltica]|nr:hypothetical protein [Idotea baltica]
MGAVVENWYLALFIALGGFLVTASANTINQLLEIDYDKQMKRTANRPLATGRMSITEAVLIAGVHGIVGLLILWLVFNPLTALLGAISLISYAFIYTPLKRISPISVFVGAIPGALPLAIGWVAATGELNFIAYTLFAIQFLWQFPHFWAIGWLGYDDYKKAGFKLLPTDYDGRNVNTAIQVVLYTIAMVAVGCIPYAIGLSGVIYLTANLVLGAFFVYRGLQLYWYCNNDYALKVMYASLFYLPITQILMYIDKL